MLGRLVVATLALVVAGCSSRSEPLPVACLQEPTAMLAALTTAPGAVAFADGTRLSHCVSRARSDAELQTLGVNLTRVADELRERARAEPAAALRLGYLTGAVRAGATTSSGIAAQLARRVEQVAVLDGATPAAAAALSRGLHAGERSG